MFTIFFQYLIRQFNALKLLFFRYFNYPKNETIPNQTNRVTDTMTKDDLMNKQSDEKLLVPIIHTIQETTNSDTETIPFEVNTHQNPIIHQLDNKKYTPLDVEKCRITKNNHHFIDFYGEILQDKIHKKYRAGIILITPAYRVVVVQNRIHKIWGFPKGKINKSDKSLTEAASRELIEETGIDLLPTKHNASMVSIDKTYYYLMCVSLQPDIIFNPIDKFEIGDVKLVAIKDIGKLRKKNKGLLKFYNRYNNLR